MENINVYEILSYGVIGLGFLLALLAYRLLTREQKQENPRNAILTAIYIFMVFSVVLCIIGFADNSKPTQPQTGEWQQKYEKMAARMKNMLPASDLRLVLENFSDTTLAKDEIIPTIRKIAGEAQELENDRSHYAYKLFKIEKIMPEYGGNINTEIRDPRREEIYALIQDALQGINFYSGTIDGDQATTSEAVRNFQTKYNERAGSEYFNPTNYGIFGYRTLEAIRSSYRLGKN
jgi:hypothetical protein